LKQLTIAHSPDADDIFMYYAIKFGWITYPDTHFDNIALDIETLNVEALKGTYPITAISFALYPKISQDYALLTTAVSFGEGYGPKIVKLKDKTLKPNFKVALSGENTTNAMLFKLKYPKARITYMNFLEIEKAVIEGVVDAGVLIHESILTYDNSLEVEAELWDIWKELSGGDLPLPLGGMAISRSLPLNRAIDYQNILIKAVDVATKNKSLLSKMLLERDLVRIGAEDLDKYLSLYAYDNSVTLSDIQYKAIDKLYELAFEHNLIDKPIKAKDYIIPTEYKELRDS